MADRRIRISKEMAELVDRLSSDEDGDAPFRLKVDVLAFAAALGASKGIYEPFADSTKEPIRQDVFDRRGYDTMMNLLAVYRDNDPKVLASNDEMEDRRATIFEEYANGGLKVVREKIKGARNYLDALLLVVQEERERDSEEADDFDLTEFVT